jgi:hypothetical protein
MSLKSFHIFFISVSGIMSLGLGAWSARAYSITGDGGFLTLSLVGFGALAALIPYGIWFLRKLKGWSYL